MWQIIFFIGGPWVIILALWYGISQMRKLTAFLMIMDEKPGWRDGSDWRNNRRTAIPRDERPTLPDRPDLPKHSEKIMFYSLIKYLACLFVLTLFTFGVLIFPMILIWGFAIFLIRKYIILWKAHKYSVLFLVVVSFAAIILSFFISPFIRPFIAEFIINLARLII
jgi:hypothetical protein